MIHLYIDTNVYLTFYHLTSDDLEELQKLRVLVEQEQVVLHLPQQTFDEFQRNRETKVADALKRFREEKLNNQFPQMCKTYPEYVLIRDAIKEYDKNKAILIAKLSEAFFENNLEADKIITSLFELAEHHDINARLLRTAKSRFDLGRPPGKNNSYGDAINWISLLENIETGDDLFFVSDDKDYYSEVDTTKFNSYLLNEWNTEKQAQLFHYRRLSDFFRDKFPEIKLASELEKDIVLRDFIESSSFAMTHHNLNRLSKFEEFTTRQINDFVAACINNYQIRWIKNDEDVRSYVKKIISSHRDKIDEELRSELDSVYHYTSGTAEESVE